MLELAKYLVIFSVLLKGYTCMFGFPELSVSPLVIPTEILARNFKKSCNHLHRYEDVYQMLQNLKIVSNDLRVSDVLLVASCKGEHVKQKLLGLYARATNNTFPELTLENSIFQAYLKNTVANMTVSQLLLSLFNANEDIKGKLTSAMDKACTDTEDSDVACQHYIPLIDCFEKSLMHQSVFDIVLKILHKNLSNLFSFRHCYLKP